MKPGPALFQSGGHSCVADDRKGSRRVSTPFTKTFSMLTQVVTYAPENPVHDAAIEDINKEAFGPGRFARAACEQILSSKDFAADRVRACQLRGTACDRTGG